MGFASTMESPFSAHIRPSSSGQNWLDKDITTILLNEDKNYKFNHQSLPKDLSFLFKSQEFREKPRAF